MIVIDWSYGGRFKTDCSSTTGTIQELMNKSVLSITDFMKGVKIEYNYGYPMSYNLLIDGKIKYKLIED